MTFTVENCHHVHSTIAEARACVFGPPMGAVKVHTPPPVPFKDQPGTMSEAQEKYLRDVFHADDTHLQPSGRRLSMNQASRLIDDFKNGRITVTLPEPSAPVLDPRLEFVDGMLDMIDEGYYAVRKAEGDPIVFIRVNLPQRGKLKGCFKVQTLHGPRLENRLIKYPSGRWYLEPGSEYVLDAMMLLVTDSQGASMLYAKEIGKCMRCNTKLTDERSRWYGIGPECEHKPGHSWVIGRVEEERGPYIPGQVQA